MQAKLRKTRIQKAIPPYFSYKKRAASGKISPEATLFSFNHNT
ncbi:hypothetical protein HMPREF9442_00583 [Paraprevotella xylaniphila YIT 11841]|uniref:Uncharacterized protein n=1 Tax=Paraprevotella xylaniphila YIT 11841 TaxID=762982 RepID=F3QQY9_9BACT|nr:hypothetical protein HMPREF9442_00583 [Paraprevotella xylaniphila YIT 11841]